MNQLQTSLFRAGLRVFEDLGFMLPTSELDSEQAAAGFHSAVSVNFSGPMRGALLVAINGDILPVLASNMLGENDAPSVLQQEDALKEVANVICGNLLPMIAGPAAVFDLGEPQLRASEDAPDRNLPLAAKQAIGLENGRADLLLFLSEGRQR
jgi:CheY-specific phosphatase CheX